MIDRPTFVQIEYWSAEKNDWSVGHAGLNLMNPLVYVQKLAKRGTIARAVDKDTGEIAYGLAGADLL